MNNLIKDLYKVMSQEFYKDLQLNYRLGKWNFGIKSFDTKEELKKYIDEIVKLKITIKP